MPNILIIDDEAPVRGYMRRVLCAAGHTVREATDGHQGLAAILAQTPDLIVCDLFMPGAEGIDTIRALRELAPGVPILVISGGGRWGLFDALRQAMSLGATTGLTKPVPPDDLIREVDALLGAHSGPTSHPGAGPIRAERGRHCELLASNCPR